jgi:DNA-binding XRE family transcriptional regulator
MASERWTVRGIPGDIQKMASEAAAAQGRHLGAWLCDAIRAAAGSAAPPPADSGRLAAVEALAAQLSRQIGDLTTRLAALEGGSRAAAPVRAATTNASLPVLLARRLGDDDRARLAETGYTVDSAVAEDVLNILNSLQFYGPEQLDETPDLAALLGGAEYVAALFAWSQARRLAGGQKKGAAPAPPALPADAPAAAHHGDGFAALMRAARAAKGWSTRTLAKAAGVSQGAVTHIENGHNSGRPETRMKIAAALGIPV